RQARCVTSLRPLFYAGRSRRFTFFLALSENNVSRGVNNILVFTRHSHVPLSFRRCSTFFRLDFARSCASVEFSLQKVVACSLVFSSPNSLTHSCTEQW